jgi:hypothetical protein
VPSSEDSWFKRNKTALMLGGGALALSSLGEQPEPQQGSGETPKLPASWTEPLEKQALDRAYIMPTDEELSRFGRASGGVATGRFYDAPNRYKKLQKGGKVEQPDPKTDPLRKAPPKVNNATEKMRPFEQYDEFRQPRHFGLCSSQVGLKLVRLRAVVVRPALLLFHFGLRGGENGGGQGVLGELLEAGGPGEGLAAVDAGGGEDRLDGHGRALGTDPGGEQPFEPFGGGGDAGAAPQGGLAQVLGEAVDLGGGEVGEHGGLLQAFLIWAERPSAVTA